MPKIRILTTIQVSGDGNDVVLSKQAYQQQHAEFPVMPRFARLMLFGTDVAVDVPDLDESTLLGAAKKAVEQKLGTEWSIREDTGTKPRSKWKGTYWEIIDDGPGDSSLVVIRWRLTYTVAGQTDESLYSEGLSSPNSEDAMALLMPGIMVQYPYDG